MELKIKKDGTILLMGEEIGKAPHTLEKIRRVIMTVSGDFQTRKQITKEVHLGTPQEVDEIGINVYIE